MSYRLKVIGLLLVAVVLTGCGAKKGLRAKGEAPEAQAQSVPAWHTCLIPNARVTMITETDRISANATMQVVRDSMLVISVMPMLGIEMLRIEATPTEIIGIDKMHAQYVQASFADINRKLRPTLNWDDLQQICTAELPTGTEQVRLGYIYGDDTIELVITYPARQTDVPVRVAHQPLGRYTQVDISRWL